MNKATDKATDKAMDKENKGNGGKAEMNNMMEIVDSCMKYQKDLMDSFAKAQKEGVERWAEAAMKLQEPILNAGGAQKGPIKDVLGFYGSCMSSMVNSVKAAADESGRIQEAWKSAAEKQMELAREMVQKLTVFVQPIGAQK